MPAERDDALSLCEFLSLPICVYVGTKDVTRDPALRKTRALDAKQGPDRFARACTYVRALKAAAARHGLAPRVQLVELADCGHDVVRAITRNDLAVRVLDARRDSR